MARRLLQSHSWHLKLFLNDLRVSISYMTDSRPKLRNRNRRDEHVDLRVGLYEVFHVSSVLVDAVILLMRTVRYQRLSVWIREDIDRTSYSCRASFHESTRAESSHISLWLNGLFEFEGPILTAKGRSSVVASN